MTTNTFTNLRTVAVPVTDQDRTKSHARPVGFTVTMDAELQPGFRWIEMGFRAGASVSLVLTGPDSQQGIDTGIRLETDDARAHATVSDAASTPASCSTGPTCRRCSRSSTSTAIGLREPDLSVLAPARPIGHNNETGLHTLYGSSFCGNVCAPMIPVRVRRLTGKRTHTPEATS